MSQIENFERIVRENFKKEFKQQFNKEITEKLEMEEKFTVQTTKCYRR